MNAESSGGDAAPMKPSVASEEGVLITRTIDAPRALVFRAWTDPERLMRWWAPKGWTTPSCKLDLRPGGVFHYCMRSPEGDEFWGRGVYREIAAPQRIVYTDSFSNEEGRLVEPSRYGMSYGYPSETRVTVTFLEREGMTDVILHHAIPEAVPERAGIRQGWTDMLGRLADDLANSQAQSGISGEDFVISRIINAPREIVFKAWTDAAQLVRWWGPHGITSTCEMDMRKGGSYRIVMRSPDGTEYPLKGVYQEIVAPERLIMTDNRAEHPAEWQALLVRNLPLENGEPVQESINTVTFDELDGKTGLTIRVRFASIAVRDAMLKMGISDGWSQSLDRLEALLR